MASRLPSRSGRVTHLETLLENLAAEKRNLLRSAKITLCPAVFRIRQI